MDHFSVARGSAGNTYGTQIRVLFSPLCAQLHPLGKTSHFEHGIAGVNQNGEGGSDRPDLYLQLRSSQIATSLHHICALPRYTHLQANGAFFKGEELPFRFQLVRNRSQFTNYTVSNCSIEHPFCTIDSHSSNTTQEQLETFKENIRHNFQKFHKLQVRVETGADAAEKMMRTK